MNPEEQIKEVQSVLDRLTRFRHFNGWAAIAAGIMAIVGFVFITFQLGFVVLFKNDFLWLQEDPTHSLAIYFCSLMVIAGIICASIIVFSLPKDLTKHGWKNLSRLVGTLTLYILAGSGMAWALLSDCHWSPPPSIVMFMPAMMCILYGLSLIHVSYFSEPVLKSLGLFIFLCGLVGLFILPYSWILWLIAFGAGHLITGIVILRNK